MGEYFKAVNVTRGEEVHPHRLDDGLKWREWVEEYEGVPSDTVLRVRHLLACGRWAEGDDIVIASDYGACYPWSAAGHEQGACAPDQRNGSSRHYHEDNKDVSVDYDEPAQ